MFSAHCKTRVTVDQIRIFPDSAVFVNLGAVWCFDPSVVFCHNSLLLYCTMCIDRRLPAPEVDDAASDSDGDEGDGEGDDRQQNNRNDGLLARDNLMRAIFP